MAQKSTISSLFKKAENAHVPDKKIAENLGQKDPPKTKWSEEQEEFLSSNFNKAFLKALAGTGKTSSLLEYARRRPHQNWTLLVFNKKTAEHIQSLAPKNIAVKTAHQFAFAHFGKSLGHKIQENVEVEEWKKFFPNENRASLQKIKKMFDRYLLSDKKMSDFLSHFGKNMSEKDKGYVSDAWEMSLSASSSFPITHDVYMKRLAQSDVLWPRRVMLDEAQDWSDAFLSAFVRSENHILCGDPYQNLYLWRFATDDIHKFNSNIFWLTQSFRQSNSFSPLVNKFLKKMQCPKNWRGTEDFGQFISPLQTPDNIKEFNPDVFLAYSQATLDKINAPENKKMTIHASKGLEFNSVWVCDDALPPFLSDKDRLSLSYVAVTRAKVNLRIPLDWNSKFVPAQPNSEILSPTYEELGDFFS